jgi:hypothetical protein
MEAPDYAIAIALNHHPLGAEKLSITAVAMARTVSFFYQDPRSEASTNERPTPGPPPLRTLSRAIATPGFDSFSPSLGWWCDGWPSSPVICWPAAQGQQG